MAVGLAWRQIGATVSHGADAAPDAPDRRGNARDGGGGAR